jgi:ATP-dependent protease ClpP protease subunit
MPNPTIAQASKITVRALSNSTAELLIYGEIGDNWSGTSVLAQDIVARLNALQGVQEITVRVNSAGGSVSDGLAIYNALRRHPARKRVVIDGVAASIASVIAMAGDVISMPRTALLMIHAPWCVNAEGNAAALRQLATLLDGWAAAMREAYVAKSGMVTAEIAALLEDGQDHWFTADEALELGLIDEVIEADDAAIEPLNVPAYAKGLSQFIPRAPAHIAASLRNLTTGAAPMPNPSASRDEILAAERNRRSDIRGMSESFARNPEHSAFIEAALDDPTMTAEAFGHRMLARLAAGREPLGGSAVWSGSPSHAGQDFLAAAADALVVRAGIRIESPHAGHRDFMTMDVADIARACLNRAGRSIRDMDRVGVIRAALTTSDFPALLGTALSRSLRVGYEEEVQSHTLWANFVQVEDFRQQLRAILSSAPELLHVPEGGEYQEGAISDDSAQYAVSKFGRIIRMTWESLVNDDLGAFVRVPQAMGQAARRKEADLVYALFAANSGAGPTMQDGTALFHASHANLATSATTLDAAALSAARTMLRKQTAKGGGLMNLQPRFLIVPAELETAAESLIATSRQAVASGANSDVLPSWIGSLVPVVEPRLDDSAFYLAANHNQVDTLEVAGLAADRAQPVVEEENEFVRDAKAWKIRHVVAAAFTDWRGIVKTPIS